jgi:hypothetical protein
VAQQAALECQTFGQTEATKINNNPNSAENIELRHCFAAACLARVVGCSCAACLGWAREQFQYNTGDNTMDQARRGNCNNQQGLFAVGCSGTYGDTGTVPQNGENNDMSYIVKECKKRRDEGKMTSKGGDCGCSQINFN